MQGKKTRTLVVDDSPLIQRIICDAIESTSDIEVIGTANDGQDAVAAVKRLNPDLVTLDIQMPKMNGLDALEKILGHRPIPVIMVSSMTQRAAGVTFDALQRGAMDYVSKPEQGGPGHSEWSAELLRKIRAMAGADVERVMRIRRAKSSAAQGTTKTAAATASNLPPSYLRSCVAIGISTGGPPALSHLMAALNPPLPPIVVVQHMPAQFTGPFASRLNQLSSLSIKEAATGDILKPNHAYIAPGGRHLRLKKTGQGTGLSVFDGPLVSGHRPSVDVMMESAAELYRKRIIGVIMTGMGSDGSDGCGKIRGAGGYVLGQDEKSSDVYGMNKVAFTQGNVDREYSLELLATAIMRTCRDRLAEGKLPATAT